MEDLNILKVELKTSLDDLSFCKSSMVENWDEVSSIINRTEKLKAEIKEAKREVKRQKREHMSETILHLLNKPITVPIKIK